LSRLNEAPRLTRALKQVDCIKKRKCAGGGQLVPPPPRKKGPGVVEGNWAKRTASHAV